MSLKKIYQIWLLSLFAAAVLAVVYFLLEMFIQYGTLSPDEEFSGLVHFLIALLIFIVGTGIISAVAVYKLYKKEHPVITKKLSMRLVAYHVIGAVPIMFLTVLGIPIFALLPFLALESAHDKRKVSKASIIFAAITIGILALLFINLIIATDSSR